MRFFVASYTLLTGFAETVLGRRRCTHIQTNAIRKLLLDKMKIAFNSNALYLPQEYTVVANVMLCERIIYITRAHTLFTNRMNEKRMKRLVVNIFVKRRKKA